jgi:hypothetical protein
MTPQVAVLKDLRKKWRAPVEPDLAGVNPASRFQRPLSSDLFCAALQGMALIDWRNLALSYAKVMEASHIFATLARFEPCTPLELFEGALALGRPKYLLVFAVVIFKYGLLSPLFEGLIPKRLRKKWLLFEQLFLGFLAKNPEIEGRFFAIVDGSAGRTQTLPGSATATGEADKSRCAVA